MIIACGSPCSLRLPPAPRAVAIAPSSLKPRSERQKLQEAAMAHAPSDGAVVLRAPDLLLDELLDLGAICSFDEIPMLVDLVLGEQGGVFINAKGFA